MEIITEQHSLEFIRSGRPWIDVRAPIEFSIGTVPNAINLPILDDEERRLVGTCYKQLGSEQATALGHKIVSGENKEKKIQAWKDAIAAHPDIGLFCFRGGQRSQISQKWLAEAGFKVPRVQGGYKMMRQLLTRYLHEQVARTELRLISGPTGSWKTHLIDWIDQENHLAIDLEEHAAHRGSAFGKLGPQPAQINFEHAIVKDFLAHEEAINNKKPLYLEDESRTIGRCIIPDVLFLKMRESPILWLDEPIEARVENIYFDYIQCTDIARSSDLDRIQNVYKGFRDSLMGIKKRLGLEKYGEIYKDLLHSETQSLTRNDHDSNRIWIRKLLQYYYDPLYLGSLERRNPVTLIKARIDEVKAFITH